MTDKDAESVRLLLRELAADCSVADLAPEDFVELSAAVVGALPGGLLRAIHRFRNRGSAHDVLLIRGLPREDDDLGLTPASATADRTVGAQLRALCLLGVTGLFGEPFTFGSLYDGRLVQDVVPAPGAESSQTSEGSDSFLDWHVEDAFSDDRCDYFALLCLRGDPAASTLFCSARRLALDDKWRRVLRQPRFAVVPDVAHGLVGERLAVPMLAGDDADPEIRFDPLYMEPLDEGDTEAREAMMRLGHAVVRAAGCHVLEPGDLLVVDNRRVAHARTAFRPRHDGTDRWLMRVMVCASLPRHRSRGAARTIA
ncbi:MAG: TauD/TfdA family dioxygenase [Micromonosporaceae bacterium]